MQRKAQPNRGFLRFFVTEPGRRLVFYAAGTTTVGLFVCNFLPHTLGLEFYKDFVQGYKNGVARPISDKVTQRLEQAMDILDLHRYERMIIKPFNVYGFDLFHAGSTKYRFGGVLGIPENYSYATADEIQRNEIRFRQKEIDWNSESGKLLQESIVLTDDEKLFGLCKSILQLQTHRVLMNSIFPSVAFLTVYTLGHFLNLRLNLFTKPLGLRFVMYSILGCFGLGSWSFMKDFNQVTHDADVDKKLCAMGPEFIDAGIRYYDKVLKKNMALRALIGDDTYTSKGNENYFIRQKSLPLTIRKSYFEQKWKEMTAGTHQSEEELVQ